MIRIIDNKKIDLTDTEYNYYQAMCRSYDTNFSKGEDLCKSLFESDENGIIQFLIPPTKKQTSLEIVLFFMNICIHQHIRQAEKQMHDFLQEGKNLLEELKQKNNI